MCNEQEFIDFKKSLTPEEDQAILAWIDMKYKDICQYQLAGIGDTEIIQIEHNLSIALQKAVICHRILYRGLSDRDLFDQGVSPKKQQYLKQLLFGPEIFPLDSHASASTNKEIGEAFTYTAPDDPERTMSILLEISSKTARYLKPFEHSAKDEGEVILLRGSKYRRMSVEPQADPKSNHKYWVIQIEEIV
jgi:hypothetical protein